MNPAGAGMLLSGQTAEDLELVRFAFGVHWANLDSLLVEYRHLFIGIGCLKNKAVLLHIDKTIQPVALRHRRVAFHHDPK